MQHPKRNSDSLHPKHFIRIWVRIGLSMGLLVLFNAMPIIPLSAQTTAYKTLLKTLYDKDFPLIYPEELVEKSAWTILDTREEKEYLVSHLPQSQWVGYDSFDLAKVENLDKEAPVVVYCTVGYRSQKIGQKLKDAGFKQVYNLYGGIIHWVNESHPVYQNAAETEEVHVYSAVWGIWLKKGVKVHD